jgi:rfaE bifunctional protein kinase chain/domain
MNPKPIVIIGDICADISINTAHTRMSPEDPTVPIYKVIDTTLKAGMAFNVENNVKQFNETLLLSYCGNKTPILELFANKNTNNFKEILNKQFTIKERIFLNNKMISRIDREDDISEEVQNSKFELQELNKNKDNFDYIIVSDYGKGACANVKEIIEFANNNNKKVIIDPKGKDWDKYSYATGIKANRKEIEDIINQPLDNNLISEYLEHIWCKYNLQFVIMTDSANGSYMYSYGELKYYTAAKYKCVDVCGCGDTYIAVLTYLLNIGKSLDLSCHLANEAAGYVCSIPGTAIIDKNFLNKID